MASFTLKIKCGKSKGMQEKVSIMGVYAVDRKKPSLGITVRHHTASLVKPISDPRDRFSWVYGVNRKIRHSESLFGITRQAS